MLWAYMVVHKQIVLACLSKNFQTAELTSELKNTFYHFKTANLVLQTLNTDMHSIDTNIR